MTLPSTDAAAPEAPTGPAQRRRARITLGVIVSCMLLIGIDATVVNVALPQIGSALGFSQTDQAWVLNIYTLVFGGFLLLGGRLGDVLGRRRIFLTGVVLFTVASLLAGLAQTAWWLLAARGLQGVGAALAGPGTMALIITNFEAPAVRGRAIAAYSAVLGAGASVGLVVGGVLTAWASWRWTMFVNVPLGAVAIALTPRYIREAPRRAGRIDFVGAVTATVGAGALVFAALRTASDGWDDRLALASLAVAVVVLGLFWFVEQRVREPLTPLRLLRPGVLGGPFLCALLATASMFSVLFMLTRFEQFVLGLTPLRIGLSFLPMTVTQFAMVRFAPRLVERAGARRTLLGGIGMVTAGMLWLAQLSAGSGYLDGVLGPLLLIGFGCGISFPTLNMTILAEAPAADAGATSGLLQAVQWLGGTLGLSLWVTVFGAAYRHAAAGGAVPGGPEAVAAGASTALTAAAISAALVLPLVPLAFRRAPASRTH